MTTTVIGGRVGPVNSVCEGQNLSLHHTVPYDRGRIRKEGEEKTSSSSIISIIIIIIIVIIFIIIIIITIVIIVVIIIISIIIIINDFRVSWSTTDHLPPCRTIDDASSSNCTTHIILRLAPSSLTKRTSPCCARQGKQNQILIPLRGLAARVLSFLWYPHLMV